jgi:hypothetical protein
VGEIIKLELSLRHILVISKLSKLLQTSVKIALEKVMDGFCSYVFLVSYLPDESIAFSIGLSIPS